MGAGVVTVGRRVYAAGLYWENSPVGRVVQAAREAANQPGQQAEFYAVRAGNKDGRIPQFGLGQAGAGHLANMAAFAGCIANQQGGSWAGAFRLREGVVLTVVRDDLIVPDGDQLYVNETEARERLLQEIGFGGLQRCYAPDAWSIPGADSMPISLLLNERRDVRLRAVSIPKKKLIIGAAIAGVLVIGLGIGWYVQEKKAEEAAAEAARLQALQRAQAQANKMVPGMLQNVNPDYPPPERKWEKAPAPLAMVEACRTGLMQVPAALAGWRLTSLKCDGKTIGLVWSREKGVAAPPLNAAVNPDGNGATVTLPLGSLPNRAAENLLDPNDVTRRYLGQNWPAQLQRVADDPLPPAPADYKGNWNPPPVPWVKRSFTVTVPELPGELPAYFGDLPGVVITNLLFTPGSSATGGSWAIQGVIYENRV